MFTGINLLFITHEYNTPLLNYDISAADGTDVTTRATSVVEGRKEGRKEGVSQHK